MPFRGPGDNVFSTYFRGWNRLDARSRQDDFSVGLRATIADPLWMLGRQWQVGELKGDDAGTPIDAEVSYEVASVDQLKLGPRDPYQLLTGIPVEVLVEREALDWDWRLRVRAGQHFERLARLNYSPPEAAAIIAHVRGAYAIQVPPDGDEWLRLDVATRRFVSLMAGRATDGKQVWDNIHALGASVPISLVNAFKAWYARLYSQGPARWSPAWRPEHLDYTFALKSDSRLPGPLVAPSYRNGSVDWETFVLTQEGDRPPAEQPPLHLTPTHALFPGMPMRRWWEFEDHAVNFGNLDVATTDLAKLLLIEFALVFGDDWFVVPLSARPNSLVRVKSLIVRDCFGQITPIEPARGVDGDPLGQWRVFTLAPTASSEGAADFLYVPPIAGLREESAPLEEIRFVRDEGANMVWAIEHIVSSGLGEPVRGFEAHLEARRRGTTISEAASDESTPLTSEAPALPLPKIEYVVATEVPDNWIPFVPAARHTAGGDVTRRSVVLRRAEMVTVQSGEQRRRISARSRLLDPQQDAAVEWIYEEAVGRAGVRVELRRQRVRTVDGETYVWLGRKIMTGRGEARSGLRFDGVRERAGEGHGTRF